MSNQPTLKKVIQIKPIKNIVEKTIINDNNFENEKEELFNVREEIERIRNEQSRLIQETEQEIMAAKENWELTRQTYIDDAYKEGHDLGFSTGKEEAFVQYQELIKQGNQTIDLATQDYNNILDQSKEMILNLAIHTAEKILQSTLSEKPEQFTNVVKTAIQEIKDQAIIKINLSSSNYELVLQQKEELQRLLDSNTKLSIHVQSDLQENQCIIEHPYGKIDASIDTQLKEIHHVLVELNQELANGY